MKKYIAFLFLVLLVCGSSRGQQEGNDLLVEVTAMGSRFNEVKWYPLNAELWEALKEVGYSIDRYELDDNGRVNHSSQTRLNSQLIKPQSEEWFTLNEEAMDGYVGILGKLLYDSTFQFESSELDSRAMRYNYLIYEAQLSDNMAANLLGLHFFDTTRVDGQHYRYVVSAQLNGQSISAQIDMDKEKGIWLSDEVELDLQIPNGLTLTDMSGRLKERPFDVVRITAKAYGDSIVLRWGPNHAVFWEKANKEGYLIQRMIGKATPDSLDTVRPWPEEALGDDILFDSVALIAAQVLYGGIATPPTNFMDQASLLENRLGFALFAAERSILAANILGLRYVDRNVEPGQTYTYAISTNASRMLTARDFIEVENIYLPEEPPHKFTSREGEGVIFLEWDKHENNTRFSAYHVERSDDDGATFKRLNQNPIVFLEDDRAPMRSFGFVDSVENNKLFHYRLIGLNPFAEESNPATTTAMAVDLTPPPKPAIYHNELLDDTTTMVIKWRSDANVEDFAGYKVLFGRGTHGDFDTLTNLLPADTLTYAYKLENGNDQTHFFKVLAYDESGNASGSEAVYIHYPDLVPPEPPTNVEATVNDDGEVLIVWDHSVSDDTEGYWVYMTNDLNELWVPVNQFVLTSNLFRDTLELKTLTKKVYYSIRTEDDNYNRSDWSEVIELARPDIIPPQAPMMKEPIGIDSLIAVSFLPSVSEDVEVYELYKRRIEENQDWELLRNMPADSSFGYLDTDCLYDEDYEYKVRARDFSGNHSEFSLALSGKLVFDDEVLKIENFEVYYDENSQSANLIWGFNPPTVTPSAMQSYEFYIFKSYGSKEVEKFKVLDGNTQIFKDENIKSGALYNYAVMVVYNNGVSSQLSSIKSIMVEGG